jgi:uncharacterized protein (DUF1330 family)
VLLTSVIGNRAYASPRTFVPYRVVILQFENMDKAKAWNDSQEQKDSRKIGDKYATFQTFAVEGIQ